MKLEIVRFAPIQTGSTIAGIYFVLGLIAMPFFLPAVNRLGGPTFLLILLVPILYALVGFVGVALTCWLYNLLARPLGGIEVDVETVGEPDQAAS